MRLGIYQQRRLWQEMVPIGGQFLVILLNRLIKCAAYEMCCVHQFSLLKTLANGPA